MSQSGTTELALEPARGGRRWWAFAATIALLPALALAGCGDDDDDDDAATGADEPATTTTVNATEADGTITLDSASSPAGAVEFAITNDGELTHEFIVLKTDLADDKLPIDEANSVVDESASAVEVVGEKSAISPGADAALTFDDLAAGDYVIICNVPGHYGLGMHAAFAVE